MMIDERKRRIASSFGAAVETYDLAAVLQRHAARRLADRIIRLRLPAGFRALEIGAGTGWLARRLCDRLGAGEWVISDLSPEMLERCRANLGAVSNTSFRCMDGEFPDIDGPFDLIFSNLTFQWFDDIRAAVPRLAGLLAPGGSLAFTTMTRDSAREWRRAHLRLGLQSGMAPYPSEAELQAMWPSNGRGNVRGEKVVRRHPNSRAFVHALKQTGAMVPARGHRPLSPSNLRRVMRELDVHGEFTVTYHIAYGVFTKDDA